MKPGDGNDRPGSRGPSEKKGPRPQLAADRPRGVKKLEAQGFSTRPGAGKSGPPERRWLDRCQGPHPSARSCQAYLRIGYCRSSKVGRMSRAHDPTAPTRTINSRARGEYRPRFATLGAPSTARTRDQSVPASTSTIFQAFTVETGIHYFITLYMSLWQFCYFMESWLCSPSGNPVLSTSVESNNFYFRLFGEFKVQPAARKIIRFATSPPHSVCRRPWLR